MWRGSAPMAAAPPTGPVYTGPPGGMAAAAAGASSGGAVQKHDIFVGNLAFNTTEEQLHQAFSEMGRVLNVRLVTDLDTGKPRGFAFVEFADPQVALAAIRNMNDYELNGRRLRVNFSNSSHLEVLAGKLGMDFSQQTQQRAAAQAAAASGSASAGGAGGTATGIPNEGTSAVASALKGMAKSEMYDVVAKLKEMADRDADEARRLLAGHPQLPEALLYLMSQLDMIKTPVAAAMPTMAAAVPLPPMPVVPATAAAPKPADPRQRAAAATPAAVDPRQRASTATSTAPADPRQRVAAAAAMDPRQRAAAATATTDPRRAATASIPPPPPPPRGVPPPPPPPPAGISAPPHLDPSLVQQVMALTPEQIQQLPADKQQSILQLRQQITGGR